MGVGTGDSENWSRTFHMDAGKKQKQVGGGSGGLKQSFKVLSHDRLYSEACSSNS